MLCLTHKISDRLESDGNFADNGLALVKQDDTYGYIDAKGQMVIPAQFENADDFAVNGLASVKQNGKWGYIDAKGQMVIPAQFENADDFSVNGLASVKQNGKWGYIDAKGQMVIPAQFESALDFSANGLASVKQGGNWGYIDANGQWVIRKDTVCDTPVVKNADDQVVWPKKPVADICAEASYARKQTEDARQREAEQECAHVYVGKVIEYAGCFFGAKDTFVITGVSNSSQQVSIRGKSDHSCTREISCYQVPR